MGVPSRNPGPMTAEEFFAFTETRPDEEKWELIEGEPVMNASASRPHQRISGNLFALRIGAKASRNSCLGSAPGHRYQGLADQRSGARRAHPPVR
jgi:hypothetical protein